MELALLVLAAWLVVGFLTAIAFGRVVQRINKP